jgi:predicted nucleic acid-binding Zn ribbon protein
MSCKKGESNCVVCGKNFEWLRHDSQPDAQYCSKKCRNSIFGVVGNKNRVFWKSATVDQKKRRIEKFFNSKVIKKDGCWGWSASLDKNGYPMIFAGHTKVKGHRVSYEIFKGEIPKGFCVCHSCDNPTCTNPEHLWICTKYENQLDKQKKGRSSKCENHYISKLKNDDAKEIKKMISLGIPCTRIAKKYKVHNMAIYNIKYGKSWKHI